MAISKQKKSKKLVRTNKGKVLAGICSGLGSYFSLDPTLVRLIFVVITVFGGSGIILYLILWLIIPSEKSSGELTDENIKENAKEMKVMFGALGRGAKVFAHTQNTRYLIGITLLVLGILWTLSNFGYFQYISFTKLWPLALIILAFALLRENRK
jgi:phage shock protein C